MDILEKCGLGVWGAISIVRIMKRIAQKLCRICLLHSGLVFFISLWKIQKPISFMIFGFLDVSMDPKTNYLQLWRHQDTSTKT